MPPFETALTSVMKSVILCFVFNNKKKKKKSREEFTVAILQSMNT